MRKFDTDTIRIITAFENITGTEVRDCIRNDAIFFLVNEGKVADASIISSFVILSLLSILIVIRSVSNSQISSISTLTSALCAEFTNGNMNINNTNNIALLAISPIYIQIYIIYIYYGFRCKNTNLS